MTTEVMIGNLTRDEMLGLLGLVGVDDPKVAAISALSWGGNALKVLRVNATENGWELSAVSGYSDEQAQDAVGTILADSSTIDFTYTDATPEITASVKDDSITYAKMQDVSATARLLGRASSGAGDVEELTATQARSLLALGTAALEGYETNTFTPELRFGGAGTGITYGHNSGIYVKIGRAVLFFFSMFLSSKGSATGAAMIIGLPFTAAGGPPYPFVQFGGGNMSGTSTLYGIVTVSSTTIELYNYAADARTQLTHANFTNTSEVFVSGLYFV